MSGVQIVGRPPLQSQGHPLVTGAQKYGTLGLKKGLLDLFCVTQRDASLGGGTGYSCP